MPRRKIVERIGLESLEVEGMKKLNKNKKLVKKLAMKEKQIFQNVQMSINFLVSLLKKNWQNVKLFTETLNKRMVEPRRNLFTVLTSRAIFQRMKNYTIYAVSITIRIVLTFSRICIPEEI